MFKKAFKKVAFVVMLIIMQLGTANAQGVLIVDTDLIPAG